MRATAFVMLSIIISGLCTDPPPCVCALQAAVLGSVHVHVSRLVALILAESWTMSGTPPAADALHIQHTSEYLI